MIFIELFRKKKTAMTFNGLHQDTSSTCYRSYHKQESAWSAYMKIKLRSAMKILLWAQESIL